MENDKLWEEDTPERIKQGIQTQRAWGKSLY